MRLDVYCAGRYAGVLEDVSPQEYRFTYTTGALPISWTMPVRTEPYRSPYLHPIFQVSLPEGDLRQILDESLQKRVEGSRDMAVLALVGRHLVGALTIMPRGEALESGKPLPDIAQILQHGRSPEILADLVRRYAQQSGVSGGYPKILAQQKTLPGTIVVPGWIVKTPSPGHPSLAVNEYFSLMAARLSGITTASAHLSDDGLSLLVVRFDEYVGADGTHQRRAFEDGASLLGLPAHAKFKGSVECLVRGLKSVCIGGEQAHSLKQFFRQYALAMVIRNGDAHLKNFGVLSTPGDLSASLAPCYDMVTMAAYAPMDPDGTSHDIPALMWEGKKRWPRPRDWAALGRLCGLSAPEIQEALTEIAAGVGQAGQALEDYARAHPEHQAITDRMQVLWREGRKSLPAYARLTEETSLSVRPG